MQTISINNKAMNVDTIIKIRKGQELAAMREAKKNGADDVFFVVGEDAYVASGRALKLNGIKADDTIVLGDKRMGNVIITDEQLNSAKDGAKHFAGFTVGLGGAALGIASFAKEMLAHNPWAGLSFMFSIGSLIAGVAVNAVPAAYGAMRKVDYDKLAQFGTKI